MRTKTIDLFTDTAAILISIVSNSNYGMPRGQIHFDLLPEHPIMSFETIEMAAVSAKRSIETHWNECKEYLHIIRFLLSLSSEPFFEAEFLFSLYSMQKLQ